MLAGKTIVSSRVHIKEARSRHRVIRNVRLVFGAVALGVFLLMNGSGGSSVCSTCGCERTFLTFEIPFTDVPYWTTEQVQPTPLSAATDSLLPPHEHTWLFTNGVNDFTSTGSIGPGRFIRPSTQSPQVVSFIQAVQRVDGPDAARHYLSLALTEDRSKLFRHWLDHYDFPVAPDIEAVEFRNWFNRVRPEIDSWEPLTVHAPKPAS